MIPILAAVRLAKARVARASGCHSLMWLFALGVSS